jgi:hypothetical protein
MSPFPARYSNEVTFSGVYFLSEPIGHSVVLQRHEILHRELF